MPDEQKLHFTSDVNKHRLRVFLQEVEGVLRGEVYYRLCHTALLTKADRKLYL
uniref:Uncharacterized protein n=1 Tax=mine drainage metagenome TaxID=410659 RepID=E6QCV9_9ZZZZ